MPYADKHRQLGCDCERCDRSRLNARLRRAAQQPPPPPPPRPAPPSTNVRTYGRSSSGIDYDAAIQAAAYYSVPPSGLPRASDRIVGTW